MYTLITSTCLQWLYYNQKNLQIAQYMGMLNTLHINNQAIGSNISQNIILLAFYIGSPRQMHNAYLDAMALVWYYSPPDYFITFMCNPHWQEIQVELEVGQSIRDHSDLVDYVF